MRVDRDSGGDGRLGELVRAWPALEPSADFRAQVWRRIAEVSTTPSPLITFPVWIPVPRLVLAAAVVVLCAWSGLGLGLARGRVEAMRREAAVQPLLQPHTLTGAYVQLTRGGV